VSLHELFFSDARTVSGTFPKEPNTLRRPSAKLQKSKSRKSETEHWSETRHCSLSGVGGHNAGWNTASHGRGSGSFFHLCCFGGASAYRAQSNTCRVLHCRILVGGGTQSVCVTRTGWPAHFVAVRSSWPERCPRAGWKTQRAHCASHSVAQRCRRLRLALPEGGSPERPSGTTRRRGQTGSFVPACSLYRIRCFREGTARLGEAQNLVESSIGCGLRQLVVER